jgi:hypothetical protein
MIPLSSVRRGLVTVVKAEKRRNTSSAKSPTRPLTCRPTQIIYEQSPEAEALNRWKHGEFLEIERETTVRWRHEVESLDPQGYVSEL